MVRKISFIFALGFLLFVAASFFGRNAPQVISPVGGPDVGGKIAYAREGALWLYTGGNSQQLTAGPQDRNDKRDRYPSFSPDGSEIIYTREDEGFADLYKLSLADPQNPVALSENRPDVEVGAVGIPGVSYGYNQLALWAMQSAWSPDGETIAYLSDRGTEYPGLYVMDPEGIESYRPEQRLDYSIQAAERPAWSPDSSMVAVTNYVTNNLKGQIWVLDLETGRWTALTDAEEGAYDAAWSPDGEWLAFTMRQGTSHNIFVVPTDATTWGEEEYPTPIQLTTDGSSRSPVWSPDGTRLAYISLRDASFELFAGDIVIQVNGDPGLTSPEKLTDAAHIDASSGLSWAP